VRNNFTGFSEKPAYLADFVSREMLERQPADAISASDLTGNERWLIEN
jgi:hypothetical protein